MHESRPYYFCQRGDVVGYIVYRHGSSRRPPLLTCWFNSSRVPPRLNEKWDCVGQHKVWKINGFILLVEPIFRQYKTIKTIENKNKTKQKWCPYQQSRPTTTWLPHILCRSLQMWIVSYRANKTVIYRRATSVSELNVWLKPFREQKKNNRRKEFLYR